MAKLHELLAVESDLESAYNKILMETEIAFTKKQDLFMGFIRTLDFFDDNEPEIAPEIKELDTTVQDKLNYQEDFVSRYFDAVLQKEFTNAQAVGDIVIDGTKIAENLPATFLLGLEKKLTRLRGVYNNIPTLAPGIKWERDESRGNNVFKTVNPEEKFQTRTIVEPTVLYEATKEHPAQVKEVSKVEKVGKYKRTHWSGMVTPAEKSKLLGKIDKLIRAVKKARQRANATKVVNVTVAKQLFDYIKS